MGTEATNPRRLALMLTAAAFLALGCGLLTQTPTPVPTKPPTPVPTDAPTATPSPEPSPTEQPSPAPSTVCEPNAVVVELQTEVPFVEFVLRQNYSEGIRSLVLWYVDPDLDPRASAGALEANLDLAFEHALKLSLDLNRSDPCVEELFDGINPIVVDADYNGWLSGLIDPAALPDSPMLSPAEIEALRAEMQVNYSRTSPTDSLVRPPAPEGSCTWQDTIPRIHQHFSPERSNVGFYFVIDEGGVNIWSQWDGPPDAGITMASMLNVLFELDCLYPVPTRLIVIVVEPSGLVSLIGMVEGEVVTSGDFAAAIEQFQVLYAP